MYLRLFMLCALLATNSNFCADTLNNPKTTRLPSFLTHSYAYLAGAFGCLAACIGIGRYVYQRYFNHTQLSLAEWITRIEKQDAGLPQIDEKIQKEANQFLAIGYHNYLTLKKAVSSTMLNEFKAHIERNPYHQIVPLLESDYFTQEDTYDPHMIYSITLEDPKPALGTPRFEFFTKNGHCVGIHLMHYEMQSAYDNEYGIDGIYRTTLYYPRNQDDSEGAVWLQQANALMHTKKQYNEFHAARQQHAFKKTTTQKSPWDVQLFTQLLAIFNEQRHKENKKGHLRDMRCKVRDIIAMYKEYDCWYNHDGKTDTGIDYVSPKVSPEMRAQHQTIIKKNLLTLLAHTPITFEKLNEMKASLQ